jgi:hypothetical protein
MPVTKSRDQAFSRARRAAFIQDILAPLRNRPADLLPFEDVRRTLQLGSRAYRGFQQVQLRKIVGSVARYSDFNRAFRPRTHTLRERWQRTLDARERLPPVELYRVDDVYFVVDGHHRVSVARDAGARTIDAEVWEYETRVPVESNDAFNDILIRQEYLEFLEQSRLDVNRPEQRLVFTVPGRYRQLGKEIAQHREWLDRQHIYTVSYEEAAADWFDSVYAPMAKVIREQHVLAAFPGRTDADLIAYILHHRYALQDRWVQMPPAEATSLAGADSIDANAEGAESKKAAEAFVEETRHNWWQRVVAWLKRGILRWEVLDRGSQDDTG